MQILGFGMSFNLSLISSAQLRPAFSIKTTPGMPSVFIARESTARTSSLVIMRNFLSGEYLSIIVYFTL
jgi:hypothetical protein